MSTWHKVIPACLLAACTASFMLFLVTLNDTSFNKAEWDSAPGNDYADCTRLEMVADLKDKILLPGLSRTEVVRILGEPDTEEGRKIGYVLGMCSGYGFDYDLMHILFDENSGVSVVKVRQH